MTASTPKPFKSITQQIEILKERNLKFQSEEYAKVLLQRYGYYEIVNGYKDCLLAKSDPDIFRDGSTFEHLYALYELDRFIQAAVRNATLEFELSLKGAMSYVIAEEYGALEDDYLDRSKYRRGELKYHDKQGKPVYEIDKLIHKMKRIADDDIQPFKHYKEKHGHIPPWILFKGASLGNMRKMFSLSKPIIKDKVIMIMMGLPPSIGKVPSEMKDLFADTLSLCYKFRNRASHSGRIFNYRPDLTTVRYNKALHQKLNITKSQHKKGKGCNDLYTLVGCLNQIGTRFPAIELLPLLTFILKRHIGLFPEDRDFILLEMGVPKKMLNTEIDDIFGWYTG